jgi:MFS transporter, OFA family, oxalate/formate antiporter
MKTAIPAIRSSRVINASPIYYGWVIVFAGAIGMILTSPGQTYAVSVFIDYFIEDLGLSRSLVSTLYTVGTLTAGFAMPFVGRQIDKRGPRNVMTIIVIAFGLVCVYMGYVTNALMVGIGFVGLRMLGQGSLSMVSRYIINQWWVNRRGMVMGIAGVAGALLGSGTFPNLINSLIPQFGWRTSYMILGLMIWVIMIPISIILVRSRPEDYGLRPDGETSPKEGEPEKPALVEDNWTLSEAIRTPVFWVLAASLAAPSMLNTGLTFHIFSIFKDSGLDASIAAAVFIPMASAGALFRLIGGYLIDRIPARYLFSFSLVMNAVVLLMAPNLSSVTVALLFGVIMGASGGIEQATSSVIWAKYFGRLHLGAITGVVSSIQVASSALGPMPMGIARDLMGNYSTVLQIFAFIPLSLAVVSLIFIKPPVHKTEP